MCNEWKSKADGYHCCGQVDEYVACEYVTQDPPVWDTLATQY